MDISSKLFNFKIDIPSNDFKLLSSNENIFKFGKCVEDKKFRLFIFTLFKYNDSKF